MDVIDLIEKDVLRSSRRFGVIDFLFMLGVALIPSGLGLLLREDLIGVFNLRVLLPNIFAAMILFIVALLSCSRKRTGNIAFRVSLLALAFGLLLAIERIAFPVDLRTSYASSTRFWSESARCFTKGTLATFAFGIWMCTFAFMFTPLPTRRRRALICLTAGVAGAVMLGFHCDSSSVAHVLISHVGQGIIAGGVIFLLQEVAFRFVLSRFLPSLSPKIKSLHKIG